jgi:hypothetical protein
MMDRKLLLPLLLALVFLGATQPATAATWSISSGAEPAEEGPEFSTFKRLQGVSCASATGCVAVAEQWAEGWNGSAWKLQTIASASSSSLKSASCPETSTCTAVGGSRAERWNGTEWKVQTTVNPGLSYSFNGVSCSSANACTAVGSYENNLGKTVLLAERWNGTSWSTQTVPNPEKIWRASFNSVSCSSSTSCIAVGWSQPEGGGLNNLAEIWNGISWSIQKTPIDENELVGVSCTSSTACTAVAWREHGFHWNGSEWKEDNLSKPEGSLETRVKGVSCVSSTSCTLIGDFEKEVEPGVFKSIPLAEEWNGTAWSRQTMPSPEKTTSGVRLYGVSCRSSLICTAVGQYFDGSNKMRPIVERYS